ncbi:MAG: hypothetical protein QXG05_07955 [Nitrososphaerota archaeon]
MSQHINFAPIPEPMQAKYRNFFLATCQRLYPRVKLQDLYIIGRKLGVRVSTKTIAKSLRISGKMNPCKYRPGRWAKHRGSPKNIFWGKMIWHVNYPNYRMERIVQAFRQWLHCWLHGGPFDIEAVVKGEEPP